MLLAIDDSQGGYVGNHGDSYAQTWRPLDAMYTFPAEVVPLMSLKQHFQTINPWRQTCECLEFRFGLKPNQTKLVPEREVIKHPLHAQGFRAVARGIWTIPQTKLPKVPSNGWEEENAAHADLCKNGNLHAFSIGSIPHWLLLFCMQSI